MPASALGITLTARDSPSLTVPELDVPAPTVTGMGSLAPEVPNLDSPTDEVPAEDNSALDPPTLGGFSPASLATAPRAEGDANAPPPLSVTGQYVRVPGEAPVAAAHLAQMPGTHKYYLMVCMWLQGVLTLQASVLPVSHPCC
jgi:hypothetical protein